PIPLDNFTDMAERGIDIIDDIVVKAMGGTIEDDTWIIPEMSSEITAAAVPETKVTWHTIEDNDPGWKYEGFESMNEIWNASGATLARGFANCTAELNFTGTAVQYYAYRSPGSGTVEILIDGKSYGEFSLENHASIHGQYYVKIFEKRGLSSGMHTIKIIGDYSNNEKTIDMLSIIADPNSKE
ncbi:MAG: hypothetical protein KJN70_13635, partial [Eudoraea sp.]|nr:hypothetical protein [Eudoraea sp.]